MIKITQYGLSRRAGGWDPDGDSGTDQWQGNHGNTLTTASCALTVTAERALANSLPPHHPARVIDLNNQPIPDILRPGALLKVTFDSRQVEYRTFDDRAPELDARLDLFNPWAFDGRLTADFAQVEVVG